MSHDDGWIVIPHWDRFQHPDVARNKHGIPPWIRAYTQLMNDDDFLALTFHQRGVLLSLWLEYATSRRQLRDNTSTVSRRLGQRITRATLDALNHAGFIEHSACKPQADSPQSASPEVEVEEKDQNPPPLPPREASYPASAHENGGMGDGGGIDIGQQIERLAAQLAPDYEEQPL